MNKASPHILIFVFLSKLRNVYLAPHFYLSVFLNILAQVSTPYLNAVFNLHFTNQVPFSSSRIICYSPHYDTDVTLHIMTDHVSQFLLRPLCQIPYYEPSVTIHFTPRSQSPYTALGSLPLLWLMCYLTCYGPNVTLFNFLKLKLYNE